MRNCIFLIFFSFLFCGLQAQEINALITVNDAQIAGSNKQLFRTLEKSLTEFVNQTKWTDRKVEPFERINCAMTIIISDMPSANNFRASIQVQSTRPVYNSTYKTPILNIRDEDFTFQYREFEPLLYNKNSFDSNLISTITFYVYVILGVDADTFQLNGGEEYLKEAENVMLQAQGSGFSAWNNQVGKQNRFSLITNLLSPDLKAMRTTYYNYHRKGLDVMAKNLQSGKNMIASSLISLNPLFNKTIGNNYIRRFFDAKSDEIVTIFSDGRPPRNQDQMIEVLRKISSNNNSKWRKIN